MKFGSLILPYTNETENIYSTFRQVFPTLTKCTPLTHLGRAVSFGWCCRTPGCVRRSARARRRRAGWRPTWPPRGAAAVPPGPSRDWSPEVTTADVGFWWFSCLKLIAVMVTIVVYYVIVVWLNFESRKQRSKYSHLFFFFFFSSYHI